MRVDVQTDEQAARKEHDATLREIAAAMELAPAHWVACRCCGYPEPRWWGEVWVSCNEDRLILGEVWEEAYCPACDEPNCGLVALADLLDETDELHEPEHLAEHGERYAALAQRWRWAQEYRP